MTANDGPGASFSWIDQILNSAGADRAFEALVERFKQEKHYGSVFNARLMRRRLELGLPLTSQPAIDEVPKHLQQRYHEAYLEAAREVGQLFLADGNVPGAWPYFRAIGDVQPIRDAIDTIDAEAPVPPDAHERLGATIQIAFQEGANPRKGFELVLRHYGMCRAVTMFGAYPLRDGRGESLRLLVRTLHGEIVENLARAIAEVEGVRPDAASIPALVEDRGWLFENNAQYTDSSHLAGLLRFCLELNDPASLRQAIEIADYGTRLAEIFQYGDDPPFDRAYADRAIYLRALAGEDVDRGVAHFARKAEAAGAEGDDSRPAEALIELLARLGRFDEAIRAFRVYLSDAPPGSLSCPTLPQLCEMAGDFEGLKEAAALQSDPLSYMAAAIRGRR